MTETKELVKALRCSAQVMDEIDRCKQCPYSAIEEITPDIEAMVPSDFEENGKKYFVSCDCDRMVSDAADLIEKLTEGQNGSSISQELSRSEI